ncbi:meiotic recombination protein REC114-like [Saccostrea echinata]|uniref:meiotic recombination protein REC114-like n=1 Tax=Saccostrea echinata TaxID=191078 RepID=UPI002A816357|nr:meiotic recombination protein REC114-like [Saccostrea echinata]
MAWKIKRYARQKTVHKGGDTIEWDDFDDKQCPIDLRIQQGNMTLIHGKTVRESHVLPSSSKALRAISKGDTLLVIYRLETHTHRFRVKFAGGENSCQECAEQLSDFFPVKILPITVESSQEVKEDKNEKEVIEGEITISKMAEVVNGTASVKLSAAYDRVQSMNGTQLNTLIKLCLADPEFPAFVEEVEKELVKIKEEMKT